MLDVCLKDAGCRRNSMRLGVWLCCLFSITLGLSVACQDSHSERRIQLRNARNLQFAADLSNREQRHSRRLLEARAELRDWWVRDVARFNHRSAIVGDYVW